MGVRSQFQPKWLEIFSIGSTVLVTIVGWLSVVALAHRMMLITRDWGASLPAPTMLVIDVVEEPVSFAGLLVLAPTALAFLGASANGRRRTLLGPALLVLAPQLALLLTFLGIAALALPFASLAHGSTAPVPRVFEAAAKVPDDPQSSVVARRLLGAKFEKLGKHEEAKKEFATAAGEFDKAGLDPSTAPDAAEAAAASRFQLAEYELLEFEKLKISGSGAALKASFDALKEAAKGVQASFDRVARYKVRKWIEAAYDRKAHVLEVLARAVLEAPVPPEIEQLGDEAVEAYREQLHDQSAPLQR